MSTDGEDNVTFVPSITVSIVNFPNLRKEGFRLEFTKQWSFYVNLRYVSGHLTPDTDTKTLTPTLKGECH